MNRTVIIIIAAVILLSIIGAAVFFLVINRDTEPEPVVYIEYEVGEMYTNLADEKKNNEV